MSAPASGPPVTGPPVTSGPVTSAPVTGGFVRASRRVLRRPLAVIGLVIIIGLVVCAIWPTSALPHDPYVADPSMRFIPPAFMDGGSMEYPLGTEALGRDILSMIIAGARYTLLVVAGAAAIGLVVGVGIGLIAGYYRGWLDSAIMRLTDIQLAFPGLILVIAVVAAFGPSVVNLVLALGLISWAPYARLVRGTVLSLREKEFIEAAQAIGVRDSRVILRHILPNAATTIVIYLTFELAQLVLLEASLAFLGLGVQPPTPSWGAMIADAQQYLYEASYASAIPGVAIVLAVLAFNFVGDEIRDQLDPRSRAS